MSLAQRSLPMRATAVLFGVMPALGLLWFARFDIFQSNKVIVFGLPIVGSIACATYALRENSLRRYATHFAGLFGAGAAVALVWALVLPALLFLSAPPGSRVGAIGFLVLLRSPSVSR